MAAFNLKQHINIPTHNLEHTLDLIITPATYEGTLIAGPYISDHRLITLETTHTNQNQNTKRELYKNLLLKQ